ncbi:MAG: ATP-binding protein [Syntrophales bacterium]|nr:ATP-binding protein [Syntrophales bacterium]
MSDYLELKEKKRRRRERILIPVVFAVIIILTFLEVKIMRHEVLLPISGNVLIFGLININLVLIILLIFLITRNVVKLFFETRKGILGSRLRTKLVGAFVLLSLVPTFALFIVSINFLSYSVESWFNLKIGETLDTTVELAQNAYNQTADHAKFYARQISKDITENRLYDRDRDIYLKTLISQRLERFNLSYLEVFFDSTRAKVVAQNLATAPIGSVAITAKELEDVFSGKEIYTVNSFSTGDLVLAVVPVYSELAADEIVGVVIAGHFIPKDIVDKMAAITKTSEDYRQILLLKRPIKFSYTITLLVITLLIIFLATWFGIVLARGITEPIQSLAEATKRIAAGDLDYHISIKSEDEIGTFVNSFNYMTRELKKSKESLEMANLNLEKRKAYMEAVLKHVSAGVISLDNLNVISTINKAAENMLKVKSEEVLYRFYADVFGTQIKCLIDDLIQELSESRGEAVEKQIDIASEDRSMSVRATATRILDDEGNSLGVVILLEDLTQVQIAERVAAWREVARRMAHEIKNPLTPIQLSAQRLQRKYGDYLGAEGSVLMECTQTIINQVDVLKNLVNAFSRYARMPVTSLSLNDLNAAVSEVVALFQDAHRDIVFTLSRDEQLPLVNIDPEQIKRVMVNLLDNAVDAIKGPGGRIEVRTIYDKTMRKAIVEVADNGCGVPPSYKVKIFEPYFSTKRSGSGLGLAIVSSIIGDHRGQISIRDNHPGGTVVSFEIPVL